MKILKVAISLLPGILIVMGLLFFLLSVIFPANAIIVSNTTFIELVADNKISTVLFTSGNDEVIGYSSDDNGPLVYTYTDTINDSDHPPKLYEKLKEHKHKAIIKLDYAPVDNNFQTKK